MTDYATEGPDEAQQIVREKPACETAPNGTGARCSCGFDCANYWLRAKGYRADQETVRAQAREAARGMWQAAFGRDPF